MKNIVIDSIAVLVAAVMLSAAPIAKAQSADKDTVTLGWEASTGNPSGYILYFSQQWTNWTHRKLVDVNIRQASVELTKAGTWYFLVTSTNASGMESGPSNLLAYDMATAPSTNSGLRVISAVVTRVSTIVTATNIVTVP